MLPCATPPTTAHGTPQTNLHNILTCPVTFEPLTDAVSLLPCLHKISQVAAERIYGPLISGSCEKKNVRCVLCQTPITGYAVDHTFRELVRNTLPGLMTPPPPGFRPEEKSKKNAPLASHGPSPSSRQPVMCPTGPISGQPSGVPHSGQSHSGSKTLIHGFDIRSVIADESIVLQETNVQGSVLSRYDSVTLIECQTGDVCANGSITLQGAIVNGNATSAHGTAMVQRSKVSGTLTCTADRISIDTSKIDTVRLHSKAKICQPTEPPVPQRLELRNSRVRNIIFEGGLGEVIPFGNSHVTGIILGGRISS